ncbi:MULTISPECIES: hypothetical protein [Halorubrum]|uniref:DUF8100 domain-containing protein n=1 Tax=Halorubrum ruber TaxID=2982524 RepID=A0A8T8LL79_9EURY|nr:MULTISPECIES: hypothetical protein [Halorubrum]QUO47231.1 hypothetical protein J7656_11670 [Halorubrum ruber]
MDRVALARWLSLALVPLGVWLSVDGSNAGAPLGVPVVLFGLAGFGLSDRLFDPDAASPRSLVDARAADLFQLGAALLVFAFLAVVSGRFESTSAVIASLRSPGASALVAVVAGALLGGGVAVLTFRWDRLRAVSQTVRFRAIGGTATFGTYLALLVAAPSSAFLYAAVYALSRLIALFRLPPPSQW